MVAEDTAVRSAPIPTPHRPPHQAWIAQLSAINTFPWRGGWVSPAWAYSTCLPVNRRAQLVVQIEDAIEQMGASLTLASPYEESGANEGTLVVAWYAMRWHSHEGGCVTWYISNNGF